jgi:hypothetical protein
MLTVGRRNAEFLPKQRRSRAEAVTGVVGAILLGKVCPSKPAAEKHRGMSASSVLIGPDVASVGRSLEVSGVVAMLGQVPGLFHRLDCHGRLFFL